MDSYPSLLCLYAHEPVLQPRDGRLSRRPQTRPRCYEPPTSDGRHPQVSSGRCPRRGLCRSRHTAFTRSPASPGLNESISYTPNVTTWIRARWAVIVLVLPIQGLRTIRSFGIERIKSSQCLAAERLFTAQQRRRLPLRVVPLDVCGMAPVMEDEPQLDTGVRCSDSDLIRGSACDCLGHTRMHVEVEYAPDLVCRHPSPFLRVAQFGPSFPHRSLNKRHRRPAKLVNHEIDELTSWAPKVLEVVLLRPPSLDKRTQQQWLGATATLARLWSSGFRQSTCPRSGRRSDQSRHATGSARPRSDLRDIDGRQPRACGGRVRAASKAGCCRHRAFR